MAGPLRNLLEEARKPAFAALDAFDRLLAFDAPPLSLGEVVIVTAKNGLYVLLEILTQLANLFLKRFALFLLMLGHSDITCLSQPSHALSLFVCPKRLSNWKKLSRNDRPWNLKTKRYEYHANVPIATGNESRYGTAG